MATEQQYFPKESVEKSETLPERERESYSEALVGFGEPSLWRLREDQRAECYRFLWLRTFDPAICVRIEISTNGLGELTKKVGTGECGFGGVGRLSLNKRKPLTNQETAKFQAQLQFYGIWAEPTLEEEAGWTERDGSSRASRQAPIMSLIGGAPKMALYVQLGSI